MKVHHKHADEFAEARGLLTTTQVCEAVDGLTFRMLDWWTRRGLVAPAIPSPGSGYVRLWSADNVERIRDLKQRADACPFSPHEGGHIG